MKRPSDHRLNGMTLLEVMMMVFIFAVLIAILFPALGGVIKRAQWMRTSQHMKSILTAFHTYADQHDEFLPSPYSRLPGQGNDGILRWLESGIFEQLYPHGFNSLVTEREMATEDGEFQKRSTEDGDHLMGTVFIAPASLKARPDDLNYYNHSFLMNRSLIAVSRGKVVAGTRPKERTSFLDYSQTMLLTEGLEGGHYNSISFAGDGFAGQIDAGFERYDGLLIHFGYLDGHVETIRRGKFDQLVAVAQGRDGTDRDEFLIDEALKTFFGVGKEEYTRLMGGSGTMDY